jgi:vitamin B12 transporter
MNKLMACLLLALAAENAAAQETQDTFDVDQIVVSATRTPLARSAVAASVTVISGAELKQKGIRTMAEALRTIPGAAVVQAGSYGAPASLFMRGGESDYVQVLIDGVQVNSPGELFDFSTLTLEDVDRIEIVRGPVSVLYGSDAVTGVIQLFTRQGARTSHFDAAAAGGSYKSGSFDGELSGGSARAAFGIGVSHFRTEGTYAFNNDHANTGITGRFMFAPASATDVSATVRYNTSTFHYPTDGAGNLVDANQHHVADAVAAGLELVQRLGARLEARAQLGFNRNDDAYNDAPDHAGDNTGFYAFFSDERFQRESADLRFNYSLGGNSMVTVGGELDRQRERGWNRSESEYGPFDSNSRAERSNRAAYAQLVGSVARVDVQAGARVEKNERFGDFATYRGGVSIPVTGGLRIRASAGTGFKEPRFYEQFATGFVRGNPDLQPETSRSLEAGVEWSRGRTSLSATWFAQRFRNLIQYVGMPAGPEDPNYLNLAGSRADGLELEAAHARGPLSLRAGLTLFDTEVTDGGTGEDPLFATGETLIRRPDFTASLSAGYTHRRFALAATANHVAERADLDFTSYPPNRVTLAAYTRVDLSANAPLGDSGLRATLKLENLLDAEYEEAFNFPSRGRVVFLGLRYAR